MKAEKKVLLSVLILPGLMAEILSTNMPVQKFLDPFVFIVIALVYGCGSLIIREARIRWKMQWSVVFLAIAYGIYEEGITTRAFFNPYWFGEGALSGNWMFFGVQWGWTILLLVLHASLSTLIPIYLVGELWPEVKDKPILGKVGIVIVLLGMATAMTIGMLTLSGGKYNIPFYPDPMLLVGSFITVAVLILLAYRFRGSRLVSKRGLLPPSAILILSFLFQFGNASFPPALANAGVMAEIGIGIQLLLVSAFALFAASQILHEKADKRHYAAYAFGSVLFWIVVSSLVGIFGRVDLIAASPVALVLLALWRRKVLKN